MSLAIVAIALVAGLQATSALTRNALRQSDVLLGQVCAENELIRMRLSRQLPDVGDNSLPCEQGGRMLQVTTSVRPTPNPQFRRIDAQVSDAGTPILQISTVMTRF